MSDKKRERWSPKERRIFRWHDGVKPRASDPMKIERRLNSSVSELPALLKTVKAYWDSDGLRALAKDMPNAVVVFNGLRDKAYTAAGEIARAVRVAFEVGDPEKAVEEGSEQTIAVLTELECIDLLLEFRSFMNELGEEARPLSNAAGQSAPPATASSSASTPAATTL